MPARVRTPVTASPKVAVNTSAAPASRSAGETVDARTLREVSVDPQLGAFAPGPRVATSDGGIVDAGDDGEVIHDETDETGDTADERPDDCDCSGFHTDASLPCWACFRDGFDELADVDE